MFEWIRTEVCFFFLTVKYEYLHCISQVVHAKLMSFVMMRL